MFEEGSEAVICRTAPATSRHSVKCRPRGRLQLGAAQASLTSNTQLHMQDPCSKEAESVPAGCGKQQNLSAAAHRISALRGTRPFPCFGSGQLHIHTLPGSLETATNTSKSRTKFEGQSSTNNDVTLTPLQGRQAQNATSLPWQKVAEGCPAGICKQGLQGWKANTSKIMLEEVEEVAIGRAAPATSRQV